MKRYIVITLSFAFVALLFTQCNKRDSGKIFNANFYTTQSTVKLTLYVDDVAKGVLPYFAQAPQCAAGYGDALKPLNLQLKSGRYRIDGKNEAGQVVSSGVIQISEDRMSTSGILGGQSLNNTGDCLAIGLWK